MPALIFDLDGTLVDTVYAHVFAWQRALAEAGLPVDGWRIHRRIGMSGGLFTRAVARELGREITSEQADALQRRHGELFQEFLPERRALPRIVGGGIQIAPEHRQPLHVLVVFACAAVTRSAGRDPGLVRRALGEHSLGRDMVFGRRWHGTVSAFAEVFLSPSTHGNPFLEVGQFSARRVRHVLANRIGKRGSPDTSPTGHFSNYMS